MPKRRQNETKEERCRRKLKKYEKQLSNIASENEKPRTLIQTPPPPEAPTPEPDQVEEPTGDQTEDNDCVIIPSMEEEELDEEVLCLLGDAPQEAKHGPPIHKDLAIRWTDIIKNGLDKEKRAELKKKYLPPKNCACIDGPKLNLEAQAAIPEMSNKRDKSILKKQNQVGCALTALAGVLGTLMTSKERDLSVMQSVSDACRLLCDHQYQESMTRRNFVLQSLDNQVRDSVKGTEPDEWLFGENFSDKLKASKAIKKSGQEIGLNTKNKILTNKPLNYKSPVVSQPRGQMYRARPQPPPQYRKPAPPPAMRSQAYRPAAPRAPFHRS